MCSKLKVLKYRRRRETESEQDESVARIRPETG